MKKFATVGRRRPVNDVLMSNSCCYSVLGELQQLNTDLQAVVYSIGPYAVVAWALIHLQGGPKTHAQF